ncbi:MAG TPA: major capsid protein, partial [Marmoricola sp.]
DLSAPPAVAYPTTYSALIYPAGTFIKGTSDVISLNAVYDSASLATNVYTALFFEEGVLVAKMCNEAALVTLPICNAGRTGAANFTCA